MTIVARGFVICTLALVCCQANSQTQSATEPVAPTAVTPSLIPKLDDGRLFSDLSDEDVQKLPRLERRRVKEWRLAKLDIEAAEREIRIAEMDKEAAEREVRISQMEKEEVVRLLGYIDTFLQLHAVRGKTGFDESVYAPMRNRIARLDLAQPHFTEELRAKVREAKRIADIQ